MAGVSPLTSQLAKGRPYALTSWGAFGPGFISHGHVCDWSQSGAFDSGFDSGFYTDGDWSDNGDWACVEPSDAELRSTNTRGDSTVTGQLEVTLDGESTGDDSATGTIFEPDQVSSAGRSYVPLAALDNGFNELRADVFGDTDLSAILFQSLEVPYQPIPYPLAYGVPTVDELQALVYGSATTHSFDQGNAKLDLPGDMDSTGDSTVEGELTTSNFLDGESTGEGTVQGDLAAVGRIAELDGESTGNSDVYMLGSNLSGSFTPNFTWAYYIYGNVITGFNPTDHVDGSDGDIIRDFARHKYLFTNINVAFDYTDDVSHYATFVSQSYPDGDIIRDFARYKYQYLLVIPEIEPPFHRLTIGPAPRKPRDLTPTPRPPRRKGR